MDGDLPQSAIMSRQQRASQEQFDKCSLSRRLYLTFASFTSTGPAFHGINNTGLILAHVRGCERGDRHVPQGSDDPACHL
jgi:hypothetical protein